MITSAVCLSTLFSVVDQHGQRLILQISFAGAKQNNQIIGIAVFVNDRLSQLLVLIAAQLNNYMLPGIVHLDFHQVRPTSIYSSL